MTHATARQIAKALNVNKVTVLRRAEAEYWEFVPGPNKAMLFVVEKLDPAIRLALLASERATFEKPEPPALPAARADGPAVQEELFESTADQRWYEDYFARMKASGLEHKVTIATRIIRAAESLTTDHRHRVLNLENKQAAYARMAAQIGLGWRSAERLTREIKRAVSVGENPYDAVTPRARGPKPGTHWKYGFDADCCLAIRGMWEEGKSRQCIGDFMFGLLVQKQESVCAGHDYAIPTKEAVRQRVRRYINEELGGESNARRIGKLGLKQRAGSICCRYDDEYSSDGICIDEWEVDAYPYFDRDHNMVFNYGAGQPVLHVLSIIDHRTTFIMGFIVTIDVNGSTLDLAEDVLRRYWRPLRLISDRASRFRQLSHRKVVTARRTSILANLLDGPLGQLGVLPRGSEEKNPRANRIEMIHRLYAQRARRDFGLAWRPPKDHRENTGIDERVQWHLGPHCKRGEPTELIPVSYVIKCVETWVDEINNSDTKTEGCNGLTRAAAFKYFQPSADEIARRKVPESVIDELFAERFERVVSPNCQLRTADERLHVNYDDRVYTSLALAPYIGQKLEFRRFRRDRSKIFVKIGEREVECFEQPHVGTNDPVTLAKECERLAHNRKELSRENSPTPVAAPAPDYLQVSSTQWMMEKIERTHAARKASAMPVLQPTSQDVADEMRRIVEENDAANA